MASALATTNGDLRSGRVSARKMGSACRSCRPSLVERCRRGTHQQRHSPPESLTTGGTHQRKPSLRQFVETPNSTALLTLSPRSHVLVLVWKSLGGVELMAIRGGSGLELAQARSRGKWKAVDHYSMILLTTPEPTVRPPSRMANRTPSSIATGLIKVTSNLALSPGMHISASPIRLAVPVTSVVRK